MRDIFRRFSGSLIYCCESILARWRRLDSSSDRSAKSLFAFVAGSGANAELDGAGLLAYLHELVLSARSTAKEAVN